MDEKNQYQKINEDIKTLTQDVSALTANVKNLSSSLMETNAAVKALADRVNMSSKTDWNVLAAWATVVIVIMSSVGYLANEPQRLLIERERYSTVRQYDLLREKDKEISDIYQKLVSDKEKLKALDLRVDKIESEQSRRTERVYKRPVVSSGI